MCTHFFAVLMVFILTSGCTKRERLISERAREILENRLAQRIRSLSEGNEEQAKKIKAGFADLAEEICDTMEAQDEFFDLTRDLKERRKSM